MSEAAHNIRNGVYVNALIGRPPKVCPLNRTPFTPGACSSGTPLPPVSLRGEPGSQHVYD